MKSPFSIIVAVDKDFGIGKDGGLPWNLPGDMKHFKEVTTLSEGKGLVNAVIMGRKTWQSIPEKFRPLPDRLNIILTRDAHFSLPSGVLKASGLNEALHLLEESSLASKVGKVFVIGGAEIFKIAVGHSQCREIFLTHIRQSFQCDRFFPSLPPSFKEASRSGPFVKDGPEYSFVTYRKQS